MDWNLHIRVQNPDGSVIDERKVHNVFTDVGKTWLRDLSIWSVITNPDVPVTEVRPRYVIAGTGYQLGLQSVTALVSPSTYNGAIYLKEITSHSFGPITTIRYTIEYPGAEFASVDLTEFGIVVDDGNLVTTSPDHTVVAYRSFETPVTKLNGQTLTLDWELKF